MERFGCSRGRVESDYLASLNAGRSREEVVAAQQGVVDALVVARWAPETAEVAPASQETAVEAAQPAASQELAALAVAAAAR